MTATLHGLDLGRLCEEVTDDAGRLLLLRELEELKAAVAAAQVQLAVAYADSKVAAADEDGRVTTEDGVLDSRRRRQRLVRSRIATELGHARRLSPHAGRHFLTTSRALVEQMPFTLAALTSGKLSEHRAAVVVRETNCLSAADRAEVDQFICADVDKVSRLGTSALEAAVKTAAYKIDPEVATQRSAYAVTQRNVSIRPAPDTMVWFTALLPVAQGVAAFAALTKQANTLRAPGDERSRGQVMADTLVERVTGQTTAAGVPVQVTLVMGERSLQGRSEDPVTVQGHRPIPASVARDLIKDSNGGAGFWLRRLYARPSDGQLVAMESKARFFPTKLAELIALRDQRCRTLYCDAPIRHTDHIRPTPLVVPPVSATAKDSASTATTSKSPQAGTHPRPAHHPNSLGDDTSTTTSHPLCWPVRRQD